MNETAIAGSSEVIVFKYGEHFLIRPKGSGSWTVSYIESVIDGKPVIAMPEAYCQAMFIEAETFECCTISNGEFRFFNSSVEKIRLERPALVTLTKPENTVKNADARKNSRLIVNILATVKDQSSPAGPVYAQVKNISSSGLALIVKGPVATGSDFLISLHMPVRNFFQNIVTIKGNVIWSFTRDGFTTAGISSEEETVENSRLFNLFYDYHLKN